MQRGCGRDNTKERRTDAEHETEVNAVRSHVRTSLARHPVHTQVALFIILNELALVDGSDAQLPLDSTDEWWPLYVRASVVRSMPARRR
jgi:hypothetical protein